MSRAYWETVAADYGNAVLSVFDHDTAGLVQARISAAAAPEARAADLGCGVGKFTPLLAGAFAGVEACDLSARGVAETRARCRPHANVNVRRLDLARDPLPFAPVEFVLCVNVLIMPALDRRLRVWRAVTNQVDHGGSLLLVVPSLESLHYEQFLALEASLHEGHSCAEAIRRSMPRRGSVADLHQGVHRLDGQRTKHYLREELERMLHSHEFDLTDVEKIHYPGHWLHRDPALASSVRQPWDWLVVARRR